MPQVGENSRGEGGISKGSDFCSSGTKKWRGKEEVSVSKGNGPLATWQVPDALNSCFPFNIQSNACKYTCSKCDQSGAAEQNVFLGNKKDGNAVHLNNVLYFPIILSLATSRKYHVVVL